MNSRTLKPTVEDFLSAYDDLETISLADPDGNLLDPDLAEMALADRKRIELAIDDSEGILQMYFIRSLPMGRAMITQAYRRLCLRLSRYLLDTVKARQSIKEDYDSVIQLLETVSQITDNVQLTEEEQSILGIEVKQDRKIQYQTNERVFTRKNLARYRENRLFFQ